MEQRQFTSRRSDFLNKKTKITCAQITTPHVKCFNIDFPYFNDIFLCVFLVYPGHTVPPNWTANDHSPKVKDII